MTVINRLLSVLFVILVLYDFLYVGGIFTRLRLILLPMFFRAGMLGLLLVLVFFIVPPKRGQKREGIPPWYDIILILICLASTIYVMALDENIPGQRVWATNLELVLGLLFIGAMLEASRRVIGPVITVMVVIFMIYAYFAAHMPGVLQAAGWDLRRQIAYLYVSLFGIYGLSAAVLVNYLIVFIVLAAFLRHSGAITFFTDLAMAILGWTRGGIAKIAVLSSMFMGSLSGAAVANVAATGSMTIPLMKKKGYRPEFAGAVEAAASTGGQIMPPVMGVTAFLMVEVLETAYIKIVAAAFIPAVLYYIYLFFVIDGESAIKGIAGLPRKELPSLSKTLRGGVQFILPIIVLMVALLMHLSAGKAGIMALITLILVSAIKADTRMGPRRILAALEAGGRDCLMIGTLCVVIGVVIGIIGLGGIGLKLSFAVLGITGGHAIPLLLLTAVACFILGTGLPTAGAYLFVAMILPPAIITATGVEPIVAHMFVFYMSLSSLVTPPVALAAFAASGIAESSPMRTALQACKLSLPLYILPFLFITRPALLLQDTTLLGLLGIFFTTIGALCIVWGISGVVLHREGIIARLLLFAVGCACLVPSLTANIFGVLLGAAVIAWRAISGVRASRVQDSENYQF